MPADLDGAIDILHVVFAALREVVTGKEFADMAAQLPAEYAPLLAAPS